MKPSDSPSKLLDDFSHGWRDWYQLNAGNHDHWQHWTRKVTDPKWRGPDGSQLALTLKVAEANRMTVVAMENEWRNYRGPRRTFTAEVALRGAAEAQTHAIALGDFKGTTDGTPLKSWDQLDLLGFSAQSEGAAKTAPVRRWAGKEPEFLRLEWK